jgi:hypothetical protein
VNLLYLKYFVLNFKTLDVTFQYGGLYFWAAVSSYPIPFWFNLFCGVFTIARELSYVKITEHPRAIESHFNYHSVFNSDTPAIHCNCSTPLHCLVGHRLLRTVKYVTTWPIRHGDSCGGRSNMDIFYNPA